VPFPLPLLSLFRRDPGTSSGTNSNLRVKAPGAPHSVTGLASRYMGSGFFGGGCGNLVSLLLVSNYPAVINYKIFRDDLSPAGGSSNLFPRFFQEIFIYCIFVNVVNGKIILRIRLQKSRTSG